MGDVQYWSAPACIHQLSSGALVHARTYLRCSFLEISALLYQLSPRTVTFVLSHSEIIRSHIQLSLNGGKKSCYKERDDAVWRQLLYTTRWDFLRTINDQTQIITRYPSGMGARSNQQWPNQLLAECNESWSALIEWFISHQASNVKSIG